MYANLLGQKAVRKLTDKDMAEIIGIHRNSYRQKIETGRFWPWECRKLCEYFGKPFEYLFAADEEVSKHE